jgi:hypothetical protein
MATASLDTAPVGEVDMGDELEDDEEAACYHLNMKSERSLRWWPYPPYRDRSSRGRRRSELGCGISKIGSIIG